MTPYCGIYDDEVSELLEVESDKIGTPLDGIVRLILTDPAYKSREERSCDSSPHDNFTEEDMAL